jgi:hypothetical protein
MDHLRVVVVTGLHSSRMSLQVSGIADEAALRKWMSFHSDISGALFPDVPDTTYTYRSTNLR